MMNDIFQDIIAEGLVCVYPDDILIFTKMLSEHWNIVWRVLECLWEHELYLKLEKCEFEQKWIEYLGVIVSEGLVEIDPVKGFWCSGMARTMEQERGPVLCWVCQLLPRVHQRLLPPCSHPVQPHPEGCQMEMGRVRAGSLQQAEGVDHFHPSPHLSRQLPPLPH